MGTHPKAEQSGCGKRTGAGSVHTSAGEDIARRKVTGRESVKQLMLQLGMTQKSLAQACGVRREDLCLWLNSKRTHLSTVHRAGAAATRWCRAHNDGSSDGDHDSNDDVMNVEADVTVAPIGPVGPVRNAFCVVRPPGQLVFLICSRP